MTRLTHCMLVCLIALLTSCGGSGGGLTPQPERNHSQYITAGNRGRVYAPPGTADPGTPVQIPTFNIQGTAAADGGFNLDIPPGSVSRVPSTTLVPPLFSVLYFRNGVEISEGFLAPDLTLESQVQHQYFGTGSGPNDMLYASGSFYVANSLDNTVTRYGTEGTLIATGTFPVGASPAFLGASGTGLLVTCNGDASFSIRDLTDLTDISTILPQSGIELAFPGPGQPVYLNGTALVPWAMIESFGPAVYLDTSISVLAGLNPGFVYPAIPVPDLGLRGHNAQYGTADSVLGRFYMVCTGEIQFDENWVPYADSDSLLTAYDALDLYSGSPGNDLNLGPLGAGRIAVSPDGQSAYLGNGLNGNLYKVDLDGWQVQRGIDNPIELTREFTYISDVAFTPDGKYLLATSFNTDELYVVEAATDTVNPDLYAGPFDLSLDPGLLAGAANVEVIPNPDKPGGYSAYVLFGVANTVARIDLL